MNVRMVAAAVSVGFAVAHSVQKVSGRDRQRLHVTGARHRRLFG